MSFPCFPSLGLEVAALSPSPRLGGELSPHLRSLAGADFKEELFQLLFDPDKRTSDMRPVEFISVCPECGTPLVRYEGEAVHYCPNDTTCPPQIKGRIEHFISRKAMNIDSLGPETVDEYYRQGLIHDAADLYKIGEMDICGADGKRIKSARKIVKGIHDSLQVPFERVVFALGIRFVGETTAKLLAFLP